MKNLIRLTLIFILLVSTSCWPNWYKPYGRLFKQTPKTGTPGYITGWVHGCESGMATQFASAFMMTFYKWKKDPLLSVSNLDFEAIRKKYGKKWDIDWDNTAEIRDNVRHYKKIFWISHFFCRHSILGVYQMSEDAFGNSMDPPLPGEKRYDPGAHSLGNIYSFHGRGNSQLSLW